jgi:hypothetical protein
MKVSITKTTSETVEVDIQLPAFRKEPNYLYKVYVEGGKFFRDTIVKFADNHMAYSPHFTTSIDDMIGKEEATIEEYAAALADFADSLAKDIESLYTDEPIKKMAEALGIVEAHSNI